MKLFGREPALILGFIASAIMLASHFIYPFTPEQQSAFNAVAMAIVGLITAWAVAEDGGLGLIVGLAKALLALGIGFGLAWTADQQIVVMTFITTAAQLFVRNSVVAPVAADGSSVPTKSLSDTGSGDGAFSSGGGGHHP